METTSNEAYVGRGRSTLSSEEAERLSNDLCKCVKNDHFVRAKMFLKNLGREDRAAVVKIVSEDGVTPLFLAAQLGRVLFVNFLLDECMADIEQRGTYEVIEDRSRHQVTPLWCAAVANKLDVLQSLLRHGANVNALSDTLSTPVRSACYMTNIDVVRFLVENGADIHLPNVNGGTCLINSVQSVELCEFLIKRGAVVNAADNSGNLALHYAIREGRLDAVRLLMQNGSDATKRNDFGDDALQTAALRGHTAILNYLLMELKPNERRRADMYSLLASNCVDEKHDIPLAMDYWRQAAVIRLSDLKESDDLEPLPPNAAYGNITEAVDLESLAEVLKSVDSVYMQALLVRERILGPDHKDTIFGLMYRGAVYADTHAYQRCIDLWKYAFRLRRSTPRSSLLAHEYLFTLQALCKLFWELHDEDSPYYNSSSNSSVRFADVMEVLEMTVDEVRDAVRMPPVDLCPEEFLMLLQLTVHLVHLLCRFNQTGTQKISFMQLVYSLVQASPRTSDGRTLLHLAVDPATSTVAEEVYSVLPSLEVVSALVDGGAAVNSIDGDGNTILHAVLLSDDFDCIPSKTIQSVVEKLVQAGAHVDYVNKNRQSIVSRLPPSVCVLNHVTLKCLAARLIRSSNIYYIGHVPLSLYSFIQNH